jgi:hypothetical protein
MNTKIRTVCKVAIVLVTLALIFPVAYLVYKASPGFLLGIGLAFWADFALVLVAIRLYSAVRTPRSPRQLGY